MTCMTFGPQLATPEVKCARSTMPDLHSHAEPVQRGRLGSTLLLNNCTTVSMLLRHVALPAPQALTKLSILASNI